MHIVAKPPPTVSQELDSFRRLLTSRRPFLLQWLDPTPKPQHGRFPFQFPPHPQRRLPQQLVAWQLQDRESPRAGRTAFGFSFRTKYCRKSGCVPSGLRHHRDCCCRQRTETGYQFQQVSIRKTSLCTPTNKKNCVRTIIYVPTSRHIFTMSHNIGMKFLRQSSVCLSDLFVFGCSWYL